MIIGLATGSGSLLAGKGPLTPGAAPSWPLGGGSFNAAPGGPQTKVLFEFNNNIKLEANLIGFLLFCFKNSFGLFCRPSATVGNE